MEAEGWYRDPYGVHEDRWFSAGRPSNLVRDAGRECYDAPPEGPIEEPLIAVDSGETNDGDDLRRAEDAARSGSDYTRAAIDGAIRAGFNFT